MSYINGDKVDVYVKYTGQYDSGFTYIGVTPEGEYVLQGRDGFVNKYKPMDVRYSEPGVKK